MQHLLKLEEDLDEDWSKKFQTKTSYVMKLESGGFYNIVLESVI